MFTRVCALVLVITSLACAPAAIYKARGCENDIDLVIYGRSGEIDTTIERICTTTTFWHSSGRATITFYRCGIGKVGSVQTEMGGSFEVIKLARRGK